MRNHGLTRRRFLRNSALGAGAVSILPILGTRPARAVQGKRGRFMVVINMLGGNDGLNMVVPAHLTPYVTRRPDINLVENLPASKTLLDLDGQFKLHYELPTIKSIWDAGDLHIVQKVSYPSPNQSHFTSQDIFSFGVRDPASNGDGRGWLGRFADEFCSNPSEPLGVVSVGMGRRRDFEASVTTPLILSSVANFKLDADPDFRTDHILRERVVQQTLDTDADPTSEPGLSIFAANQQAYALVDQVQAGTAGWAPPTEPPYPVTTLGRNLATVSQLLHGRDTFQTKVFYTGYSGFDTHSNQHVNAENDGRHASLMEQLNDAIAVFQSDMIARNMWNDCVVVVISEFGRRVFQNGSAGTDHGHGNPFLVMGGRVKGKNDAGGFTGALVESDIASASTIPFEHDFRDLYGNVIQNHLGLNPALLFPDPDYTPAFNDIDLI